MSKNTNLSFLTDYITADITNGRIGINNASPTVAFDVTGVAKFSTTLTVGGNLTVGNSLSYGYIYGPSNQIFGSIGANTTWLNAGTSGLRINNAGDNTTLAFVSNSGNVGIGTTSPTDSIIGSGTFLDIASTGGGALKLHYTNATAAGELSFYKGSNGSYIDSAGAATLSNNDLIFRTGGTASNYGVSERMRITSGGNVGIGNTAYANTRVTITGISTTSSNYGLVVNNSSNSNLFLIRDDGETQVRNTLLTGTSISSTQYLVLSENQIFRTNNGIFYINNSSTGDVSININGGGTYVNGSNGYGRAVTVSSDERIKKNIVKVDNALNKILQMIGVYYEFDSENELKISVPSGIKRIGLIAQQIENILPEAVLTPSEENEPKSIDYSGMIGLLIEGIKELSAEITILKNK